MDFEKVKDLIVNPLLDHADVMRATLAGALQRQANIETNYREAKLVTANTKVILDARTAEVELELMPALAGIVDPATGKSNKDYTKRCLDSLLAEHEELQALRTDLEEAEAREQVIGQELGHANVAVKLASLDWQLVMAELAIKAALLNYGSNGHGS